MKIVNDKHITLHEEAQDIINQAWFDAWHYCFIGNDNGMKWPTISLCEYNGIQLNIRTTPNYIAQTVLTKQPTIEIRYNYPLLTIAQIKQLYLVLE